MHQEFTYPENLASVLKRILDLVIAIPGLLLPLPFCGVIALLIKLDSPGPVFYLQERLGKGGRLFKCIKFRTMYVENDSILQNRLENDPGYKEEWSKYRKLQNDPRVTRIGRVLRKSTLDELPQFFNVIKGDMSIVGPRPYLPTELPDMGLLADIILSVRPGMAGIWIAKGRNELTFQQRVELEADYVLNWSLWNDCILFLQSFRAVLLMKGAR